MSKPIDLGADMIATDTNLMTALDCLREMSALGRHERSISWANDLRDAPSWDEHAKLVNRLRRDLKDVRHYASNPADPMTGQANYFNRLGA